MVYKLKHPNPSTEGFFAGVDFSGGYGTTSSLEDANKLRSMVGCELFMIVDGVEKPIDVVTERHRIKFQGTGQEIETGPPILRAVLKETNEAGAGQLAPAIVLPAVTLAEHPQPVTTRKADAPKAKGRLKRK